MTVGRSAVNSAINGRRRERRRRPPDGRAAGPSFVSAVGRLPFWATRRPHLLPFGPTVLSTGTGAPAIRAGRTTATRSPHFIFHGWNVDVRDRTNRLNRPMNDRIMEKKRDKKKQNKRKNSRQPPPPPQRPTGARCGPLEPTSRSV